MTGKEKALTWGLIAVVVFACLGSFCFTMTDLGQNEAMYVTAGWLVARGKSIYRDFAYTQMPYLPLFYGCLYKLLGVKGLYFLIAKFISYLFFIASAALIYRIARKFTGDTLLSLCIMSLFLLNLTILYPAAEVSNYIIPIALSLLGFNLFVASTGDAGIRRAGLFFSGLATGLAIGVKLTTASVLAAYLAAGLWYAMRERAGAAAAARSFASLMLPFGAGCAAGLLPVALYLSDFDIFYFNNLKYHALNARWRQMMNYTSPMTPGAKLLFALSKMARPENLLLMAAILLGATFTRSYFSGLLKNIRRLPVAAALAASLSVITFLAALAPTPSFRQYYALPVACLFLVLVASCVPGPERSAARRRKQLCVILLLTLAWSGIEHGRAVAKAASLKNWTAVTSYAMSAAVIKILADNGVGPGSRIATLYPLIPIESNYEIFPEFATGDFTYRIGDLLTREQRKRYVVSSPGTLHELLDAAPPRAILAIPDKEKMNEPFIEYARTRGYTRVVAPFLPPLVEIYVSKGRR